MPSQFFGLQIGYSGLTAYQAALNTTGNNISNVETKGYSRQVVNQTASLALRTYSTYGMAGSGTVINSIDQMRNSYYDTKYRAATTSLGEYDIKSEYNAQIENYFNDDGLTVMGFSTLYDSFYNALENVENNPGDVATRTNFTSSAKALCEFFNSTATSLERVQSDCNTQIKTVVEQINSLAERIATLNHEINIIELKGNVANELRDERNNLVDELSQYIDVEVREDPIYTTDQVDEEGKPLGEKTGTYKYTLIIAGNNTLVEGYGYRTLDVRAKDTWNKVNQSDADGLYDIYWKDSGIEYYPVGNNYSGQLKALLQIRDGNNNENFNGSVQGYNSSEHSVTISATADYLQDLSKCTLSEEGVINIGNGEYRFKGWTVDIGDDGVSTYTFYIADDEDQVTDRNGTRLTWDGLAKSLDSYKDEGKEAKAWVGDTVDYQGIPYYQEQMNEWVRLFAQTFNEIEQQEGAEDIYGNQLYGSIADNRDPLAFFVARNESADSMEDEYYNFYDDYDYPDTTTDESDQLKKSTSDCYRKLTAGNFTVNTDILNNAGKMSSMVAKNKGDGALNLESSDIISQLEGLKDRKNFFRGCTSSEFLSCVLGDIALNASSANTFQSNFGNIQSVVVNQRLSVSGVDTDEEALNLVKFQNAYNLSAKMIQVMTEVYDRLILETGV